MVPANLNLTAKFETCHAVTAAWEGGWSNHKADPGGKTMYGVTQAVFWEWLDSLGQPRRPVRSITKGEALQIYFTNYWRAVPCQNLVPGVDLAAYDAAVNSGVSRARKWLLASLDGGNDHAQTVKTICGRRLSFVQALRTWKTFGRGWSNRIADIQAKGVARALAFMHDPAAVQRRLEDEASVKAAAARKQAAGSAGTAVGGTGAIVVDTAPAPDMQPGEAIVNQAPVVADWLLAGLGVALLGLTLWLVWRAYLNHQQGKAFAQEANRVA